MTHSHSLGCLHHRPGSCYSMDINGYAGIPQKGARLEKGVLFDLATK